MSEINNPVSYYRKMGFLNMDSMVYTCALFAMAGGILGSIQSFRTGVKHPGQYGVYAVMLASGTLAAMEGLSVANEGDSDGY